MMPELNPWDPEHVTFHTAKRDMGFPTYLFGKKQNAEYSGTAKKMHTNTTWLHRLLGELSFPNLGSSK